MLTLTRPDLSPITTWQEWTPPKKAIHWRDGRSAMELAKSWFRAGQVSPPQEFLDVLQTMPGSQSLTLLKGIPELVTQLPIRGEGRNHDLWLLGKIGRRQVTICVEAKVDEPYGDHTIAGYNEKAVQRQKGGTPTRVPARIDALLGIIDADPAAWRDVRYQLLTALAGTILQARLDNSPIAVLAIHEFRTAKAGPVKLTENAADLARMLTALGGAVEPVHAPGVFGPWKLAGVDCYIAKVVTQELAQPQSHSGSIPTRMQIVGEPFPMDPNDELTTNDDIRRYALVTFDRVAPQKLLMRLVDPQEYQSFTGLLYQVDRTPENALLLTQIRMTFAPFDSEP